MSADSGYLRVDLGAEICAFFTTRGPDAASDELSGLNLSHSDAVPAGEVVNSRAAVARVAGAPLHGMTQVHGNDVAVVDRESLGREAPLVDGLVTSDTAIALMVLVADCVPVLLADPQSSVIAAVHAGRLGVKSAVVVEAVSQMRALGARTGQIRAALGPAICGNCYEVPEHMRDEIARIWPQSAARTGWGTPALDLPAAIAAQLREAGIRRVQNLGVCTLENHSFYSYRRNPVTGRQAGVIRLQQ